MMKNEAIFAMIKAKGLLTSTIRADSARPEIIQTLRDMGMYNLRAAKKGRTVYKRVFVNYRIMI